MNGIMLNGSDKNKINEICKNSGGEVLFDHPLSFHTTIGVGGNAGAFYAPSSIEGLSMFRRFLKEEGVSSFIVGRGSNILVPDDGLDAVIIRLSDRSFSEIEFDERTVVVGAGMDLSTLIRNCAGRGLAGLEGLAGIPATVGGAVFNNASYKTAISEYLVKVRVMDIAGDCRWVKKDDLEFAYRFSSIPKGETIINAVFELREDLTENINSRISCYFEEKMEKQPLKEKTLGCIFKNPGRDGYSSGELIDRSGLKLFRHGAAEVSDKHANFIVNKGGARAQDVVGLMGEIREKVYEKFSIDLEPEIEVW